MEYRRGCSLPPALAAKAVQEDAGERCGCASGGITSRQKPGSNKGSSGKLAETAEEISYY